MIRRHLFTTAAYLLGCSDRELLAAAVDGEFTTEVFTSEGFKVVPLDRMKRALRSGYVSLEDDVLLTPAKTKNGKLTVAEIKKRNFDGIMNAENNFRPAQEWQTKEFYFRDDEIVKHSSSHVVQNSGPVILDHQPVVEKKAPLRTAQTMATKVRDSEIRIMGLELLESPDGEKFRRQSGRPDKTLIRQKILRTYQKNPKLASVAITDDIVRKALTDLPDTKPE